MAVFIGLGQSSGIANVSIQIVYKWVAIPTLYHMT